jgi:5'-nucleotidase
MGKEHFWFTATPPEETEKDTDHWAFNNGCASITPLRLDLTDEQAVECTLSNPPALSGLSPVLR